MALKEKLWMVALAAAVIVLIGWFTPYIYLSYSMVNPMPPPATFSATVIVWFWLQTAEITGYMSISGSDTTLMILGIIMLILTIAVLITGFLAKKREDLKKLGIIWLVCGIISLILLFVPLMMMAAFGLPPGVVPLHVGFYLPLIGIIIEVIAGALAFRS